MPTELLAPQQAENPYKGLRAFGEADAADFFGRAALTEQLLARMREPHPLARFLAVVGPSGSGKSSVVRAGLVPALKRGALPGAERWFVLDLHPGAQPIEELAQALVRVAVDPPDDLVAPLLLDSRGLLRVVDQAVPGGDETEVVLVIDQFEELFTLVADEARRRHFLDTIVAAATDPYSRVRVVVTLRADFYDRPLLYPEFGALLRQRTEVVLPLAPGELEQAIAAPAQRVGVAAAPDLVAAIVGDVGAQPGALPLLQYALTELFEQRTGAALTLAAYRASGGMQGALARRADALYAGLQTFPLTREAINVAPTSQVGFLGTGPHPRYHSGANMVDATGNPIATNSRWWSAAKLAGLPVPTSQSDASSMASASKKRKRKGPKKLGLSKG